MAYVYAGGFWLVYPGRAYRYVGVTVEKMIDRWGRGSYRGEEVGQRSGKTGINGLRNLRRGRTDYASAE